MTTIDTNGALHDNGGRFTEKPQSAAGYDLGVQPAVGLSADGTTYRAADGRDLDFAPTNQPHETYVRTQARHAKQVIGTLTQTGPDGDLKTRYGYRTAAGDVDSGWPGPRGREAAVRELARATRPITATDVPGEMSGQDAREIASALLIFNSQADRSARRTMEHFAAGEPVPADHLHAARRIYREESSYNSAVTDALDRLGTYIDHHGDQESGRGGGQV